jgi:hypothetical protein
MGKDGLRELRSGTRSKPSDRPLRMQAYWSNSRVLICGVAIAFLLERAFEPSITRSSHGV